MLGKVSLWRHVPSEKDIVAIGLSHIDHDSRREVARPFRRTEIEVVASGYHVNSIAVTQIDPRLEMFDRLELGVAPKTAVNNVVASVNGDANGFLDDDIFTAEIFIQDPKTSSFTYGGNPILLHPRIIPSPILLLSAATCSPNVPPEVA